MMTEQEYEEAEVVEEAAEVEGDEPQGEVAVEQPEAPAKDWSDEEETDARILGWKSPDEWKGEQPPGYIADPREYLERLEKSTPFRKQREHYDAKLRGMERVLKAQAERQLAQQKQDYEARMAEIARRERQAVEEGNVEDWERLQGIKAKMPRPEPVAPAEDPVEAIKDDFPWLGDGYLRQQAAVLAQEAVQAGTDPNDARALAEYAEPRLRKYYPHLFDDAQPEAQPKPQPRVDGGGLAGSRKRAGFDTLPSDVKAEFNRQVKMGVFKDTKDDKEFFFNEYQG
jgi:hypothetical protein